MLVVDGFLENGVFIPNRPLVDIKKRQSATLTINENDDDERQKRILAWRQFSEAILNSEEKFEDEPERANFKFPEELI